MGPRDILLLLFAGAALPGLTGQLRAPSEPSRVEFTDVTSRANITFKHTNASTGQKFLMETMGPGVAFFDYNGDGYLDIYVVNGGPLPGFKPPEEIRNALLRNNKDGTFTDVTTAAGVSGRGYGMGVVAGDYDNDGDQDLYITNFGSAIIYRNNGNGTFTEVTDSAGVNNKKWGTSAAFFDYDNDGFLDLFVCNYVDFSLDNNIFCGSPPDFRTYCSPVNFQGMASVLFHNNRDGTFTDVSERSGISGHPGKSLGVVTADFNGDGFQDIYVANDQVANFLFVNQRNGTFQEIAALAGAGLTANGNAQSGMGVAAGDYDGDGDPDVIVTNLSFEGYTLFHNEGSELFADATFPTGVGAPSLQMTGWGIGFLDFDNDGDEDILSGNGHVMDNVEQTSPTLRYLQTMLLLENLGGRFIDATGSHGSSLRVPRASRGLAFGDIDNDGDTDVLVGNCNEALTLLRNDGGYGNYWLTFAPVGKKSSRDAIGLKIKLTAGGRTQTKDLYGGGSYMSAGDRRLHFGLGKYSRAERVEILWPSGKNQVMEKVQAGQIIELREQ